MSWDNPYDKAEHDAREEDRRQSLQDGAEEAENERRQLAKHFPVAPELIARSIIAPDCYGQCEECRDQKCEDDDYEICGVCSGSGEGQHEGTRCYRCKGRGTIPPVAEFDEPDPDERHDHEREC